jgi:REP element-mobilizing transposase RayT
MPHTFSNVLTHVVFGTKDHEPLIGAEWRAQLHARMGGIVRELKGTALIINGTGDHVHLLVSLPPDLGVSDAMRVVKADSSRWVNEARRTPFAWQGGYGAFSVGGSSVEAVSRYIARQEEHHRRMTFHDEFIALLRNGGCEFDERRLP